MVDGARDRVFERDVEVTPVQWFTPAPWKTAHAEVELRPGVCFRTVMEGPAGKRSDGLGCVLEVVPGRRFTWTSALGPDVRPGAPAPHGGFVMTAPLAFEPRGTGTRTPQRRPRTRRWASTGAGARHWTSWWR